MQVFRSLEEVPSELGPTVVSVGNFDGVHRAHQEVVQRMADRAHSLGGKAVVVTFEPHPYRILRPDVAPRLLTPLPIKLRLLQQTRRGCRAGVALHSRPFVDAGPRLR